MSARPGFKRLFVLSLFLAALAAAYRFRAELSMAVYNSLSADDGWKIVALEDLWARPGAAGIGRLVLEDGASGRRVEALGLQAEQAMAELLAGRSLARLTVRQLHVGAALRESADSAAAPDPATWLSRLRAPLFGELSVESLYLPIWPLPLSLRLAWGAGESEAVLRGGPWRAEAWLESPESGDAAVRLVLSRDAHAQASVDLRVTRQGSGYQLAASGRLDVPDTVMLPQPLASYARWVAGGVLEWQAGALLPEDPRRLRPSDLTLGVEHAELRAAPGAVEGLESLELALAAPFTVALAGEFGPELEVAVPSLDLRVEDLRHGEQAVDAALLMKDVWLRGGAEPAAAFTLDEARLRVSSLPPWLTEVTLQGEARLEQAQWTFQSELSPAGAADPLPLRVSAAFHPQSGGRAVLVLPRQVFSAASPLSARFPRWPFPFDLLDGELEAELQLALNPPGSVEGLLGGGELRGQMSALTGYHGDIFVGGLSGPLQVTFTPGAAFPLSTPTLGWTLEHFDPGVDLSALALDFRLQASPPALAVEAFSADVLGGELRSPGFVYAFDARRNTMSLAFENLRMERVLDLVDQPGVEASGGVSGELPLAVVDGKPSVEAGRFHSEAPGGIIRYTPARPVGEAVNPGLGLVEQALSDYRFEHIDGTLDYTPDGDVEISMRIQGYNPSMNDGQRINLNLTLSDNLPVLLRSLQAGRTIEDMLEEQL